MSLLTPRWATSTVFFIHGTLVGTWLAQIPWVQGNLKASNTELGVALLFTAVGALIAMPITGQWLTRVPSRRMVRVTTLLFVPILALPLLAPTLLLLALSLLLFGALNGAMDVSMNSHGIGVERALGRPIMSSLHGFWSMGALVGAATVAVTTGLGVDPLTESLGLIVVLWLVAVVATSRIGSVARPADATTTRIQLPSRAVLPLGLLAMALALIEGGIGDWAGIYMRKTLDAGPGLAAAGFTAFALGMTVGRLSGDILNRRLGPGRLLQSGAALAAALLGVLLLAGQPYVAIVGFVLVGLGVANGLPLLFSAGGRIPPSGPSLSAVFTVAYAGFLVGPPVIGFLSDRIGLTGALACLAVLSAVVAFAVRRAPGVEGASVQDVFADPVAASITEVAG